MFSASQYVGMITRVRTGRTVVRDIASLVASITEGTITNHRQLHGPINQSVVGVSPRLTEIASSR